MNLLKSWTVPIETVSEGNLFEHWHKSAKRHKKQKNLVNIYLKELSAFKDRKIIVKLIRISPRTLDKHDNLPMAFKFVVDAIADLLNPGKKAGRADDSDLITWEYGQEKGKPKGIRVEIYEK
jgi:hypothetical protein